MKSGRKYLQFLKNSSFMKLYALVFPLAMQNPDWVGTSCINLFVTWILFCVAPYCSGKENIWVGTPFGSCKLLFCDPILFHKLANAATHWKIDAVGELQIICFVKTHKLTHLWLILWGLHSLFSRKVGNYSLKYFSCLWCHQLHQKNFQLFLCKSPNSFLVIHFVAIKCSVSFLSAWRLYFFCRIFVLYIRATATGWFLLIFKYLLRTFC